MRYFIYYLVIINIICFLIYGLDKLLAIYNKRRVSERCLFFFSFISGGFGGLFGMCVFRHKTKKVKFYLWNGLMIMIYFYIIYSWI